MIKAIEYGERPLPFSQAIRSADLVFVSGQASVDLETGKIIPGTLQEEMTRSISNLRLVLELAGASWGDIVKVGCYLRRESDLPEYNRHYQEFFGTPYPARTTLTGCLPETILFEIDCVARLTTG